MPLEILNRDQIREVDRRAVRDYGMSSLVLMENAGRGVADVLFQLGIAGPVVICCGKGNNAGDGFVVARHLDLRGATARVLMWTELRELSRDAADNYRILAKTDVPIVRLPGEFDSDRLSEQLQGSDWIVDALLGTGAHGQPRRPFDTVIDALNSHRARKLAVDVPSGLDCESGQRSRHIFRADHTCTFVAAKPAFVTEPATGFLGQIHVLDIGVPRKLVDQVVADNPR